MSRIGEELVLALDDVRVKPAVVPWAGASPRDLTREGIRRILKAQAGKSMGDGCDTEQYDLWLSIKKAPWKYQGAPLLISLGTRSH